jgi:hypothetical protein
MNAQASLSAKTPAFDVPGDASWRLWVSLKESLGAANPTQPRADAPDRLPLSLPGRCLTPDGFHVVCEAVAITARGLTVTCEVAAYPGEGVSANFRGLGEIRGVVESNDDGWFVMDIRETPERLAVLSKRLLWSIRRRTEGALDRRMSERIDQKQRKTVLKTSDGREIVGEMLDLSVTGAAVRLGAAAPYFWVGQEILLDDRSGRVRRHFTGGVGVEFDEPREVGVTSL